MQILSEEKRTRFRELRHRELNNMLSAGEQTELAAYIQEIEDAEAVYLRPATERLRAEREELNKRIAALEALVQREEAVNRRLEQSLAEAQAEHQAIREQYRHIMPDEEGQAVGAAR